MKVKLIWEQNKNNLLGNFFKTTLVINDWNLVIPKIFFDPQKSTEFINKIKSILKQNPIEVTGLKISAFEWDIIEYYNVDPEKAEKLALLFYS